MRFSTGHQTKYHLVYFNDINDEMRNFIHIYIYYSYNELSSLLELSSPTTKFNVIMQAPKRKSVKKTEGERECQPEKKQRKKKLHQTKRS